MAAAKPKSKKGKKPSKSMENMAAKKGPKEGEVSGKMSLGQYFICWNCGNTCFVPAGWTYFICPYCHVANNC